MSFVPTKRDRPPGYGSPPKQHQFKPGQSGNPSGRPKGSKNKTLHAAIARCLETVVPVTIDGKRQRLTKAEVIVTQLTTSAMKGEIKAIKQLAAMEKHTPPQDLGATLIGTAERLKQKFELIWKRQRERRHPGHAASGSPMAPHPFADTPGASPHHPLKQGADLDGQIAPSASPDSPVDRESPSGSEGT